MIEHSNVPEFSVMIGLIVEMLFVLFLFITLCIGLKISEHEAYRLTDFPLINN